MTKYPDILFVLPWVGLENPINLGDVTFIPWKQQKGKVKNVALRNYIDDYTKIFVDHSYFGKEVKPVDVSVALYRGKVNVSDDCKDTVYKSINLLFFYLSLISDLSYINSNSVEFRAKAIEIGKRSFVFGPRRAMTIGADFNDLLITKPLETVSKSNHFSHFPYEGVLEGLGKLLEKPRLSQRVDRALDFYKAAYIDSQFTHDYFKISEIISAIECLEGGNYRYDIVSAVESSVKTNLSRQSIKWRNRKKITKKTVSRAAWATDKMYESRNNFRHAGRYEGIYLTVNNEKIPMWDVGIYIFQMFLVSYLDKKKLLKLSFPESWKLQSYFDDRVKSCVERARSYREYQEKKSK